MKLPPLIRGGARDAEPKGWDRASINGEVLPGHAKVTKGGEEYRLDKKDALGIKGSKPSNAGPSVQEVELEITVWTDAQVERLTAIVAELRRVIAAHGAAERAAESQQRQQAQRAQQENRQRAQAVRLINSTLGTTIAAQRTQIAAAARQSQPPVFDFDAPAVRHLGVTKVMVKEIGPLLESTEIKGGKKMMLRVAHWARPEPTGSTPQQAAPPTRQVRNIRREVGDAGANPIPSQQEFVASPTGQPKPTRETR